MGTACCDRLAQLCYWFGCRTIANVSDQFYFTFVWLSLIVQRSLPSSTSGSTSTAPTKPSASTHRALGPIIGGAVGGFLIVIITSVAILTIRYRRRHHKASFIQPISRDIPPGASTNWAREETSAGHQNINPFPPPFPSVGTNSFISSHNHDSYLCLFLDYFNYSKQRGQAIAQPVLEVFQPQPNLQVMQTPSDPPPPAAQNDTTGSTPDSIQDLVNRLNRAIANLPPPSVDGSFSTELPRYENITWLRYLCSWWDWFI